MHINRALNFMAASSFRQAATKWHRWAQPENMKGPLTKARGNWARKRLQEFHLKYDKRLIEHHLRKAMYQFAMDSQLQKSVLKDPWFFNDPVGRPFVLFKRFAYRQATYMKDMLVRETLQRGNIMPLLRLGAVGYLGGEFMIFSLNAIKNWLSGEEHYRKNEQLTLKRMASNLAIIGSFGMLSDMLELNNMKDVMNNIQFVAYPVFANDIDKFFGAMTEFMADWNKYDDVFLATERNAYKFGGMLGSYPRYAFRRTRTKGQKELFIKRDKRKELDEIIELLLNGNASAASWRVAEWNHRHKKHAIKYTDVSYSGIRDYLKRRIDAYMRAKGYEKPSREYYKVLRKLKRERTKKLRESARIGVIK